MSKRTYRNPRGMRPHNMDPLSQFFWNVEINVDFHDEELSYKPFREACWYWLGGLHDGITPWFKPDNNTYLTTKQWIMKQLHPDARPRQLAMVCDSEPEDFCVNPFHIVQIAGTTPRGQPRKKPVEIAFADTPNRPKVLHHVWRNAKLVEEETLRQRALPQYFA